MGIRGLNTFFNQNPDLSKPYKLHDTSVIIDGNNLVHALYFAHKIDCIYGGDYIKYASVVRKYLSCYIECNIKPIIVFDGGYDKSDRKLKTILKRSKVRLTLTEHIAKYGGCSGHVLPIMAHYVFQNVLEEMGIPFARCDYEADEQVTALANYYKCPVISDDSDFYIFDVQYGFIRLDSVEPNVVTEKDSDGNQNNFLKCDIYHIDKLLSYFPGINKDVLPLFGTLIGNDFVSPHTFDNFFSNIRLPKYKGGGLRVNTKQKKILGLLCWLKDNNLNEAVKQVLVHLKKEKRQYVKSVIDYAIEGYRIQKSNVTYIIDGRLDDLKRELKLNDILTTPCGQSLPAHFIIEFQLGCFPAFFLNVITLHRVFLPSQVENVNLESSYMCSRFIRQVLYGILIRHEDSISEKCSQACLRGIDEYDRRNGSHQKELIKPVFALEVTGELPKINELGLLEKEKAEVILLEVLGIDGHYFTGIPKQWQLLFGCINYWLRTCVPGPREEFVSALILNIIYFSLLKEPLFVGETLFSELEHGKDNSLSISILGLAQKVTEDEKQFAAKNLKKYVPKPVFNHGNPLILYILHSFSQLQTCILYSIYLNQLLGFPYLCPLIHKSFNGIMVYNLTKDIATRQFPELFVSELLGRDSVLSTMFSRLKGKITENIPESCFVKTDLPQPRKHKKKDKKGRSKRDESSVPDNESNKFSCLSALEDEDVCIYI